MQRTIAILLVLLFCTEISGQLPLADTDFRGLWVTKFRTNVLGNAIAEDALIDYALDNDFNYLICTNMFQILTEDCGSFSSEMVELQDFVQKAHEEGITYVSGNVGSGATGLKVQNYNDCVSVTAIQKLDMITYECEFYNDATNGSCEGYASYIGQLQDIKMMCDTTESSSGSALICEAYIGGSGSTGLVLTVSSEMEMKEIASTADHVLLTYYRSTPFSSGGNFFNWTIQRLEWLASDDATDHKIILLLKSRDTDTNNMYDYLQDHDSIHYAAVRDPYRSWVEGTAYNPALTEGYKEKYADGTYPWLDGIHIKGFTWFENEANLEIGLSVLPLNMLSFYATANGDREVELEWEVENASEVEYFSIKRSFEGKEWVAIKKVKPWSVNENKYHLKDKVTDDTSVAYYRIDGVDKDGESSTSEIRRVVFGEIIKALKLYPTRTHDYLFLEGGIKNEEVKLFNIMSQELKINSMDRMSLNGNVRINCSSLVSGWYYVKVGKATFPFIKL